MKRFVLTRPANRDLEEIKAYLIANTSPTVARRVLKDIHAGLILLGKEPGLGHVREDLTDRPLKFWPVYSYLVVYDPRTEPVQIIGVVHGMRDVEDILN